jgi:hypothetical protein
MQALAQSFWLDLLRDKIFVQKFEQIFVPRFVQKE